MLKKFFKYFLVVFFTLASFSVFAKQHNVTITLQSLVAEKTAERHGDKIYISVTQYPSKGQPYISRVPMYPLHWLTKDLSKVRDVPLWQGTVNNGESTLLVLSLLEQGVPLLETDANIGSAEVRLVNKDGKISVSWGQPHFADQPKVEQLGRENPTYIMFGDKSEYKVGFRASTGLVRAR